MANVAPGGTHTITAKATDAAGNVSNASSGLSVVIDATVPTAGAPSVSGYNTSSGGTSHTFSITYADTGVGLDTSTFGVGNVTVKDGSNNSLTITNATASGNTVTYTFTAPGGTWDTADAGTYTIGIVANSVKDIAGNAVAANGDDVRRDAGRRGKCFIHAAHYFKTETKPPLCQRFRPQPTWHAACVATCIASALI